MNKGLIKANGLLLLCAAIWGFAFVAQRAGMEHIGPFIFNGIRFLLGAISLVPLLIFTDKARSIQASDIWGGVIAGTVLFFAASCQQVGVVYTTAGKAGFITGLYSIIVPFLGYFFLRHKIGWLVWLGAFVALAGLYLLSIKETILMERGDLFVLVGAFFWALQILVIGHFTLRTNSMALAMTQFTVCSLFSFATGFATEQISLTGMIDATVPLLYAGIFSTGVAFTLQIVAQKRAHPSHASIIMSMESLFAVIGGWLMLGEGLSARAVAGCALMLLGMMISQLRVQKVA